MERTYTLVRPLKREDGEEVKELKFGSTTIQDAINARSKSVSDEDFLFKFLAGSCENLSPDEFMSLDAQDFLPLVEKANDFLGIRASMTLTK